MNARSRPVMFWEPFTAESNFVSDLAFFLFYIGIALAFVVVIIVAVKALRATE